VSRKEYDRVKAELAKALADRADKSKKNSADADKVKNALQRQLLESQQKFKEEQKKEKKVKRELDMLEMKESAQDSFSNIIMPHYEFNSELKVYMETNTPSKALYKAVGYNDLNRIKLIMEGDDSEKRSLDFQKQMSERQNSLKKKNTMQKDFENTQADL
jgi:hypothetical protein